MFFHTASFRRHAAYGNLNEQFLIFLKAGNNRVEQFAQRQMLAKCWMARDTEKKTFSAILKIAESNFSAKFHNFLNLHYFFCFVMN